MAGEDNLSVPEFRRWIRKCCEDAKDRELSDREIVLVMLEEVMARVSMAVSALK